MNSTSVMAFAMIVTVIFTFLTYMDIHEEHELITQEYKEKFQVFDLALENAYLYSSENISHIVIETLFPTEIKPFGGAEEVSQWTLQIFTVANTYEYPIENPHIAFWFDTGPFLGNYFIYRAALPEGWTACEKYGYPITIEYDNMFFPGEFVKVGLLIYSEPLLDNTSNLSDIPERWVICSAKGIPVKTFRLPAENLLSY